jgi:hypothetical protein
MDKAGVGEYTMNKLQPKAVDRQFFDKNGLPGYDGCQAKQTG